MEEIEDTLKRYRTRKRRQEKIRQTKECIKEFFMIGMKNDKEETDGTSSVTHTSEHEECLSQLLNSSRESDGIVDVEVVESPDKVDAKEANNTEDLYLQYVLRFVYIALWITLYIIAIELQFGIVFLMFSALSGIYLNTRTGPKKHNEISAYSVFNKNCESIDGTLKAEQFEREIGIR